MIFTDPSAECVCLSLFLASCRELLHCWRDLPVKKRARVTPHLKVSCGKNTVNRLKKVKNKVNSVNSSDWNDWIFSIHCSKCSDPEKFTFRNHRQGSGLRMARKVQPAPLELQALKDRVLSSSQFHWMIIIYNLKYMYIYIYICVCMYIYIILYNHLLH